MPKGVYIRNKLPNFFCVNKNGCWDYLGKIKKNGYGEHRYYYEKYNGKKIPIGMTLDHLCKNKICVNPEHLEVVTYKENIRRSSNLNYNIIEEIKNLYKFGFKQIELSNIFNTHQSNISRIINGNRWG